MSVRLGYDSSCLEPSGSRHRWCVTVDTRMADTCCKVGRGIRSRDSVRDSTANDVNEDEYLRISNSNGEGFHGSLLSPCGSSTSVEKRSNVDGLSTTVRQRLTLGDSSASSTPEQRIHRLVIPSGSAFYNIEYEQESRYWTRDCPFSKGLTTAAVNSRELSVTVRTKAAKVFLGCPIDDAPFLLHCSYRMPRDPHYCCPHEQYLTSNKNVFGNFE